MINFKKLEEVAFALMPKYRGEMRSFHVAAIYKKSKLISIGYNKDISHPKIKEFRYHKLAKVHAELMACLRGGREDYAGHSMAILRINRNNKLDYSCPCNGCSDILTTLMFKNVFHTTKNQEWEKLDIYGKEVTNSPQRFCELVNG